MSASQYYSVTARVGVPHRHEVEVTVPLVGPTGATGPAGAAGASAWDDITGKPSTFAPSAHTHTASEITDLGTAATAASTDFAQAVTEIEVPNNGTSTTTLTAGQLPARVIIFVDADAAPSATINLPTPGVRQSGLLASIKVQIESGSAAGAFITVVHDATTLLNGYELDEAESSIDFLWDGYAWTYSSTSRLRSYPNRVLQLPSASGTIALTSDIPSGGSKTYATFAATDNQPPASNYATLDTRNSIAVLDFDDATDESAVFVSIIPEGASLGSGLKIRLHWMATTATSGDVVWDVSLERMTTDLDSDSFDTIASGTAAANGTSGILTVTEITLTTIDSVTAGDGYRLKVTRDANNASDTMTGDAELVVCEVRSAA